MKFIAKCIFILLLCSLVILFILSLKAGYQHSLDFFISLKGQQRNAEKLYALLPISKFHFIQKLMIGIFLAMAGALFYFNELYTKIAFYVKDFWKVIRNELAFCIQSEGKYVLLLPFLLSCFFAFWIPVSYDEAWTYLNFTSKGIFSSITYYPAPNNHILHSVITNITSFIPFVDTLLCMRISTILFNTLCWCIAYCFTTKYFNKTTALVVIGVSSMLFMSILYSYMSRGYALVSLFFITALYSAFNIIMKEEKERNWIAFGISAILGFYSMPSFLYPLLTLNALIFLADNKHLKKIITVNFYILITTGILYLPVMIISGTDALINNRYVTSIPREQVLKKLPAFFSDTLTEITGIPWIIILLLLAVAFITILVKKDKRQLLLFGIFLLSPFALLIAHSVIPFGRTFIYYHFLLCLLILIPWKEKIRKVKESYLITIILLIQGALVYNFYTKIKAYDNYSFTTQQVVRQIKGNKGYVCNDGLFDAFLLFELDSGKFKKSWMNYYNNVEMSADTIYNMDYIIINTTVDKTSHKLPKIQTKYYNVYEGTFLNRDNN